MAPLVSIIALAFVAVCVATDVRTRRVPNLVSVSGMLAGMVLNSGYFGAAGLFSSLAGALVMVALLLGPFALGGVGGGDVKMMAAVGAFLGPRLALVALGSGMVLGGAVTAVQLTGRGRLREKLAATGRMLAAAMAARSLAPLRISAGDGRAVALPYTLPLALGTAAALVVGGS
ncbi:MAG: prepilin peptidase [Deltaproteobacteria bacterium]|nr:MAG: hypothetical protein DMD33_03385 [Gemmatimonadota bacterium]TMA70561.1 MAG: prepilin peptidase [Deltaproteobacteria bacterium]